jgi:hypothetical protein
MLSRMSLVARIAADLTQSMKAQDAPRTGLLRMLKSALKNREIDKHAALDDGEAVRVVQALIKQREDAAEQFAKAGRAELADKELAEIAMLRDYLPEEVPLEAIEAAVAQAAADTGASSAKDMGKVMKAALALLQATGKPIDGRKVNDAVRRRLGA